MAVSITNSNNTVFQQRATALPEEMHRKGMDNTGFIEKSSSRPLDTADLNRNRTMLAQHASSHLVGIDIRIPDITKPVSDTDKNLLSKQISLYSQSSNLMPTQNEKVPVVPEKEIASRSEKIMATTSFLGGYNSVRFAPLIELAKTALLSKHAEHGMKTKMLETSQKSLENSVEHSMQAAREQLKKDLTSSFVTSGMALTGGIKSHKGHSQAIKGYEIQGAKITQHKSLGNKLDTHATLSRGKDINDPMWAQDMTRLKQSANREHVLAQKQEFQLQTTLSTSQQQIGVGQALQGGALAMGTISSSQMILSQAEQNGLQQLRQFDKDVFMQESQRNDERAQDAEKLKAALLATLENIAKGISDTAGVVANNTKV
ncbi:hypothetical protein [Candidatus Symbiopectobacterium sp. NZEC135]|uniref:hypothetical protein n=1 Tax=Candidatus Symbiopectobacterium sp. NZEC135 TaxID=2820471 RepID=UPI0022275B7C|nr:hypothetical protein [Candidatus Symbiopectobacterium sp. NZEC135]MCW2480422.1 hypothetical protein [Candidatus Symbiopectobacterium sp. NZEC135]